MFKIKLPMNWLLKRIAEAEDEEVTEIMKTLIYWQRRRHSEYELVILSLPRNNREEGIRQIDLVAHILKKHMYTETGAI